MTRLLTCSKHAAEAIMDVMNNYSGSDLDIDSATKVSKLLKDVSGIIKSLDLAMKQAKAAQAVKKEVSTNYTGRIATAFYCMMNNFHSLDVFDDYEIEKLLLNSQEQDTLKSLIFTPL